MNPIFLKSLIGIVVGSGVAATSYGAYNLFSSKTIKDELIKQNLNPLDTAILTDVSQIDLNGGWNKLIDKLIKKRSNSGDKIINITSIQEGQKDENKKKDINGLKTKCNELFNKKYETKESKDYKDAKDWCTPPL